MHVKQKWSAKRYLLLFLLLLLLTSCFFVFRNYLFWGEKLLAVADLHFFSFSLRQHASSLVTWPVTRFEALQLSWRRIGPCMWQGKIRCGQPFSSFKPSGRRTMCLGRAKVWYKIEWLTKDLIELNKSWWSAIYMYMIWKNWRLHKYTLLGFLGFAIQQKSHWTKCPFLSKYYKRCFFSSISCEVKMQRF